MRALRYLPFARRGLVRRGPPIHLTLFVTGRCNLRCRHCFHWREVAAGTPGPSAAEIEALARSCADLGPLLWVSFGGGEPFLRGDLAQLAASFASRGLAHLTIPTNGWYPERAVRFAREVLRAHPDLHLALSVSFDGPPAIHDQIRDARGAHAKAMECVRALVAAKAELPRLGVGLSVCVTRENQDSLAAHVEELVLELAPDNVTVNLARSDALDRSLLDVDVARYEEVVAAKRRLQAAGKLAYFDFPLSRLARARDDLMYEHVARTARAAVVRTARASGTEPTRAPQARHLPCTAGSLSAVVFEDGEVRPCEVLPDSLGNLNEVGWDLGQLWQGQRARELRDRIRRTRCACTFECAQADNVLFGPRSWPALLLRVARPVS